MHGIATLAERKKARAEEIRCGFGRLRDRLVGYGRLHGGRFWVYGSAATGHFHFESDIDVLVDFGPAEMTRALDFVEKSCAELHLKADAQPKDWCTPDFLEKISATTLVLP